MKSKSGLELLGVVALVLAACSAPAQAQFFGPSQIMQSQNNLKQCGLAMMNYESTYRSFPSPIGAAKGDTKPLLSWRVAILPYVEQSELYKQFKLTEPWDSEHNKKLIEKMPKIYAAPGSKAAKEFRTVYLLPRGEKSFPADKPISFSEITDGTSNTIMLVEASDEKAVIWTKPDDYEVDLADPIKGLVGLRKGEFLALFCDSSVHKLSEKLPKETLAALFTRNGKETVGSLVPPKSK